MNAHNIAICTIPGAGWSNGDIEPSLFPSTQAGHIQKYSRQRRWIGLASGWTRIGEGSEHDSRHSSSKAMGDSLHGDDLDGEGRAVRSLIAQLCERFYYEGWATGTGGGISIRVGGPDEGRPWRVFVAPSGIQKEDMIGDDVFELDMDRNVIVPPKTSGLRQSACTPLWYVVYRLRPTARAVIHTHSMNAVLATLLDSTEESTVLRLTHLEMLKGVGNHAYDDLLEVPIIDNRPTEDLLAEQLEEAVRKYPKANAVLVRRHGLYAWGDSWEQAKTQCESFDYLFECAIRMHRLGLEPWKVPRSGTYREDTATASPPTKKLKANGGFNGVGAAPNADDCVSNAIPILPRDAKILLLDIEGCTTSISFVKDELFPYVRQNLDEYLQTLSATEKKTLCESLTQEVKEVDSSADVDEADAIALVSYLMDRDVKSAALKDMQGKMWKNGYAAGQIKSHVYPDFPPTLDWMKQSGVSVYIYSSGSIQAQKLLFAHSVAGDLLPKIDGHFDIPTAGGKKESASYTNIAKALSVDPSDIVFVSDAEGELVASREAGIGHSIMSVRPGNEPLTAIGKEFPLIYSLLQLCGA